MDGGREQPRPERAYDEGVAYTASSFSSPEANRLLGALSEASYAALEPHLEVVQLAAKQVLWQPNSPIRSVYFPRTCVTSLLTSLPEEEPVESATVGREGFVGVEVIHGVEVSFEKIVVQLEGEAVRLPTSVLRDAITAYPALLRILLLAAQTLLEQTAQSVACNARHTIDQRCARWLLLTHDRVGADEFNLTHEFLAQMLGVRRPSVTTAAGMLQQAGFIRNGRGRVTVIDRGGLEQASCACYRIVTERMQRLLP